MSAVAGETLIELRVEKAMTFFFLFTQSSNCYIHIDDVRSSTPIQKQMHVVVVVVVVARQQLVDHGGAGNSEV